MTIHEMLCIIFQWRFIKWRFIVDINIFKFYPFNLFSGGLSTESKIHKFNIYRNTSMQRIDYYSYMYTITDDT